MMNAVEKYLFGNSESCMKKALYRFQNDFTSVAGKLVRIAAIIQINDNIKTGYRHVNFLVIDLDDKVKIITVKVRMGEMADKGEIVKEVKLSVAHLKPIYALFHMLGQIKWKGETDNV